MVSKKSFFNVPPSRMVPILPDWPLCCPWKPLLLLSCHPFLTSDPSSPCYPTAVFSVPRDRVCCSWPPWTSGSRLFLDFLYLELFLSGLYCISLSYWRGSDHPDILNYVCWFTLVLLSSSSLGITKKHLHNFWAFHQFISVLFFSCQPSVVHFHHKDY